MLFDDVVREYMAAKAKKVRPNTYEGYESAIRCHLMPKWSGRELEEIRHSGIA